MITLPGYEVAGMAEPAALQALADEQLHTRANLDQLNSLAVANLVGELMIAEIIPSVEPVDVRVSIETKPLHEQPRDCLFLPGTHLRWHTHNTDAKDIVITSDTWPVQFLEGELESYLDPRTGVDLCEWAASADPAVAEVGRDELEHALGELWDEELTDLGLRIVTANPYEVIRVSNRLIHRRRPNYTGALIPRTHAGLVVDKPLTSR